MATTPEEFFMDCLKEQQPTYPSVCPDLSPVHDDCSEGHLSPNDMVLPYISRMLMEDDIEDKLSDHSALLQVQQPFAEILYSFSFGPNMGNNINIRGNEKVHKDSLQDGSSGQRTTESAFTNGVDVAEAFLKGEEEAKMFLPEYDCFRGDDMVNRLSRESTDHIGPTTSYNKVGHLEAAVSMTSKATTKMKEPESVDANKMLDEMLLQGCKFISDMKELRITMANEAKNSGKDGSNTTRVVVDLSKLLIHCAQAVAENNHTSAWKLLMQIKQHASATGNATQRLAQCFTKGLEARLGGMGSQPWQFRMMKCPLIVEYLEAYRLYMSACCFDKVALVFSIRTVLDTVEGHSKLHIVDYGLDYYGFQWACLLRLLAKREGGPPEVKITAISHPEHWFSLGEQIEETGRRLYKCALELRLPSFKFRAISKKWEDVCIGDLDRESDEVLVVNDQFNLSTLMDESVFFDIPNPRDTVLNNIRKMRPDVFIQNVISCTYGTSFSSRFKGALFYYMALFDMLDATTPRDCKKRMLLEQGLFGRYALNAIACEGVDVVQHPEKYTQWQARNQRAGLRQMPLNQHIVKDLANEVNEHHKDFLLSEDGQWLLQGWMGRILFAHSTWVADGTLSD